MPRARVPEMAPRVSTRGPISRRSSSSDSDPLHHHRPVTDRSPKLSDRRSPRNAHSDPLSQKKLGTRIAGLETQLEQAQGELKILKDQLKSAEVAKKEAQKELQKKATKSPVSVQSPVPAPVPESRSSPSENDEHPDDNQNETDVFEVPIEMVSQTDDQVKVNVSPESTESPEKPLFEEAIAVKNDEISSLKLTIEEKEKKLEAFIEENDDLKRQLSEANLQISSVMVKEQKVNMKLTQIEEQFKNSKQNEIQLKEKLKELEEAKEGLESEMKRLRVQTEQWRKAADAAASILSGGGVEMGGGRRVTERCGSLDDRVFEGFGGFGGSPGFEFDDGFGTGKKKGGSGIRMFGDLWKKKGHK